MSACVAKSYLKATKSPWKVGKRSIKVVIDSRKYASFNAAPAQATAAKKRPQIIIIIIIIKYFFNKKLFIKILLNVLSLANCKGTNTNFRRARKRKKKILNNNKIIKKISFQKKI